ncbi:flagellar hook-length control protein FliK [Paenibacillus phoenicis]|uniref:Flagellar hook-length control protein FliK n=1 Tax=Paenibacillus phoenicis TaxID=554117 RepID=A0ABU5PH30_9BACL|nr:flagellar hook-length control protein FliK [Paenibacillus phoenicis]MEA3569253.1 flagellar hook-length control protein FliK [Paenibacillus phoenicis]
MNIGPLLRSLMGDVRSGEPKSLELKTGQVVRGTVLSVSDDGQVAVIQVQGVKLHAALETPMRPGETTLLQVQPESKDGLAVLKPISSDPGTVLSPASLAKALESLGLENTPANREFLQMMQKSGIPLTRENLSLLQQVSGLKPAGVPLSEWIQAAGIAFGRGLPITGETVAGLHQAVFGPPLHVLLSSLEEQIAGFLRQAGPDMTGNGGHTGSGSAAGSSAQTGQTASPLLAGGTASPAPGSNAGTAAWGAAQAGTLPSGGGAQPNQAAGLVQLARQGAFAVASGGPQSPQPGLQGQQAASAPGGALVAKLQAVLAELQSSVLPEGTDLPGRAMAGPAGGAAADGKGPAAAAPQGEGPAGPSPAGTRPTLAAEPWVGRVLKLLGAEHEQQAPRDRAGGEPAGRGSAGSAACGRRFGAGRRRGRGGARRPGARQRACGRAGGGASAAAPCGSGGRCGPGRGGAPAGKAQPLGAEAAAAAARSGSGVTAASTAAHETLKGLLLQVMASDELPAPLHGGGGGGGGAPARTAADRAAAAAQYRPDRAVCAGDDVPALDRSGRPANRRRAHRVAARTQRRTGSGQLPVMVRFADEDAGANHGRRTGRRQEGAAQNLQRKGNDRSLFGIPPGRSEYGVGEGGLSALIAQGGAFDQAGGGGRQRSGFQPADVLCA